MPQLSHRCDESRRVRGTSLRQIDGVWMRVHGSGSKYPHSRSIATISQQLLALLLRPCPVLRVPLTGQSCWVPIMTSGCRRGGSSKAARKKGCVPAWLRASMPDCLAGSNVRFGADALQFIFHLLKATCRVLATPDCRCLCQTKRSASLGPDWLNELLL